MVREVDIGDIDCGPANVAPGPDIENKGLCCVVNTLYKITDVAFIFLTGVAIIVGLIGAVTIIMAAGAAERVTSGRNYIIYAIVGLALAVLVRAIPAITVFILGG